VLLPNVGGLWDRDAANWCGSDLVDGRSRIRVSRRAIHPHAEHVPPAQQTNLSYGETTVARVCVSLKLRALDAGPNRPSANEPASVSPVSRSFAMKVHVPTGVKRLPLWLRDLLAHAQQIASSRSSRRRAE
jgi:hypothetical protein